MVPFYQNLLRLGAWRDKEMRGRLGKDFVTESQGWKV